MINTTYNQPTIGSNNSSLTEMQQKMQDKLAAAQFRWLNEQLYTSTGVDAYNMMQQSPELFDKYHVGFRHQTQTWPVNPVDIVLKDIFSLCPTLSILSSSPSPSSKSRQYAFFVADMGCGDAVIAQKLHDTVCKVHSFDLVSKSKYVTACDMGKVPLPNAQCDIVIFCLSLMSTDWQRGLVEGIRILKPGGHMLVSEVISRFSSLDEFVHETERHGMKLTLKDTKNKMFVRMHFVKSNNDNNNTRGSSKTKAKQKNSSDNILKPCIYKRR